MKTSEWILDFKVSKRPALTAEKDRIIYRSRHLSPGGEKYNKMYKISTIIKILKFEMCKWLA